MIDKRKQIDIELLKSNIKKKGLKRLFVSEQVGLKRTAFHNRMIEGKFKPEEIKVLKKLKLI